MPKKENRNESNLLIPEPPLQVLPTLAVMIGLNEAITIQQLHYWLKLSGHMFDGRLWIYNSYEDWQRQFPFWSAHTIKRTFIALEKNGLILSEKKFNKIKIDRTKWYSIDYLALKKMERDKKEKDNEIAIVRNCTTMRASCPDGQGKTAPSHETNLVSPITREETTSETTTTQPVVVVSAKNDPVEKIFGILLSAGVIRKAMQDYSAAAHEKYQPETPAQGVARILGWMTMMGDIQNPAGFLRKMAKSGMDMPPAVIRAEQAEEARAENAAREKKEKADAEKIAREIRENPLTPEDRKKIIMENAPKLLEKAENAEHAPAGPARIGSLLGEILAGGIR
jgi:hypothetical protein